MSDTPRSLLITSIGKAFAPRPDSPYRVDLLQADCLYCREGRIEAWLDSASQAAEIEALRRKGLPLCDASDALLLPGFVDSHTHPVFFAHRAEEYEMRNAGRDYLEIQRAGGGILSSRRSLMAADPAELKARVRQRLKRFLRLGTTTVEAKSGYGLSVEHELLSLRLLKELDAESPMPRLYPTLLAAHSVPPEHREDREEWFRRINEQILPVVVREGLAKHADAFCEPAVLSLQETETLMSRAREAGLGIKLHAEQIESAGGGALAARLGALSADHLEEIDEAGIQAMVEAGTVFALLPGSTYFLGMERWAPARRIIEAGGRIALCTDFNPGSSHIQSMPFILSLATCRLKMSAEEAVWAATAGGALALDAAGEIGCLEPGAAADLCLWPFQDLAQLPYTCGDNRPARVILGGEVLGQEE